MKGHMFNIDNGYLEGLCRGFKNGILKQADYLNLVQCETLEGKKAGSKMKTCDTCVHIAKFQVLDPWVKLYFTIVFIIVQTSSLASQE